MFTIFIAGNEAEQVNFGRLIVLLCQLLPLHPTEIVESADSQLVEPVLFDQGEFEFKVFDFLLLGGSDIGDHLFGRDLDVLNLVSFRVFDVDFHASEADVAAFGDLLERSLVGLDVVFGGSQLQLDLVLEDEGGFGEDVEVERRAFEGGLSLQLVQDGGVDESGNT